MDTTTLSRPQGYLVFLAYDNQLDLVTSNSGAIQVENPNELEQLLINGLTIDNDGFLHVEACPELAVSHGAKGAEWVSNGSTDKEIDFDNFLITTAKGKARQINHYGSACAIAAAIAYGLRISGLNGISEDYKNMYTSKELQTGEFDQEVSSGLEMYDFHARFGACPERSRRDPQLGRWFTPDPAEQFSNPYLGIGNNPVMYQDPDGEWILPVLGLLLTDVGYDIQKYVSPVALHVDIDLPGGGSQGVGIKTSVGVPQIAPLHARVHGGIGYYEYDDHLGGSERSGFQTTHGFEAGFNIAGAYQVTYGQTFYNSPGDKFDQKTGHFVVGNPLLNFKLENDFFGDKGDKYRSGAGEINAFGIGVGFSLFTGDPGSGPFNINPSQGPFGTYIAGSNSNPDEYRAGGFYLKTPFGRFGKNSENSRAFVQNLFIHQYITSSPYFRNLGDDNDYFYYQSGSGIGFLY
jgi:RHS repeat-associated protein